MERTNIYYCDPVRSGQKGGVENAHTMLRMVLPKGTSFEFLAQWDVNLTVNHINSTPRERHPMLPVEFTPALEFKISSQQ